MAQTSNLDLLRKLLDQCERIYELERADLTRRIKEAERARPGSHGRQPGQRHEHERALLRIMQQAKEPLPPREIAQRLDATPKTVSRWLAAAKRRGYVERVGGARYQVTKEVPLL